MWARREPGRGAGAGASSSSMSTAILPHRCPPTPSGYFQHGEVRGPRERRWFALLTEKAFGSGLKDNVAQAYWYVMEHWPPGDAVYIFGFSRGAHTAVALAGTLPKRWPGRPRTYLTDRSRCRNPVARSARRSIAARTDASGPTTRTLVFARVTAV